MTRSTRSSGAPTYDSMVPAGTIFKKEDYGDKVKYIMISPLENYRGFVWVSKESNMLYPKGDLVKNYLTWKGDER